MSVGPGSDQLSFVLSFFVACILSLSSRLVTCPALPSRLMGITGPTLLGPFVLIKRWRFLACRRRIRCTFPVLLTEFLHGLYRLHGSSAIGSRQPPPEALRSAAQRGAR